MTHQSEAILENNLIKQLKKGWRNNYLFKL